MVKCIIWFHILSALPIQRANQLVQENQALLQTVPQGPQGSHPRASPQGPYRGRGAQGRGRGGRGRGWRGGHHMTPQKRATLLEMVRRNVVFLLVFSFLLGIGSLFESCCKLGTKQYPSNEAVCPSNETVCIMATRQRVS